jgi:hypothetical protein
MQHQILVNRLSQIAGHVSRLDLLNSGPRSGRLAALLTSPAPSAGRDASVAAAFQSVREQGAAARDIAEIWEQCFALLGATDQLGEATAGTTPEAINRLTLLTNEVGALAPPSEGSLLPQLELAKDSLRSIDMQAEDLAGLNCDLRALCAAAIERSGAILCRIAPLSRSISASVYGAGLTLPRDSGSQHNSQLPLGEPSA